MAEERRSEIAGAPSLPRGPYLTLDTRASRPGEPVRHHGWRPWWVVAWLAKLPVVQVGAGVPRIARTLPLPGDGVATREAIRGAAVHLTESLAKRCKFLGAVVDELALPAVIHNARAESTRLSEIEVVTARACAPMDKLLSYAAPLMRGGARGLFLKGESAEAEIAAARQAWRFEADLIPSKSDPSGRIVSVRRLVRV